MSKHSPTDCLLQIPIALGQAPEALSAKKLPLTLGQPLNSTYRHLRTLLRWGLAEEQTGQGCYLPGPACLRLAKEFDCEASLIGLAKPELKCLVDLSQENMALMVASNQQAIYLELFDGPQSLHCCYQKGLTQPLLHSASAKALLAHLEDGRHEELYLAQELSTERTDRLRQELRLIREQGYAVNRSEIDEGVWDINVPLLDSYQHLYGALGLMTPALHAQSYSKRLRQWTPDAAAQLSARLDWPAGVSMYPTLDISLWQGWINSQEDTGARR